MGMQGSIMDIGHASGPILAGLLIGTLGFQAAFSIIAGLVLLAAVGFLFVVGQERPAAPAP
jgi:predicted MFS family arabinose efflux permease